MAHASGVPRSQPHEEHMSPRGHLLLCCVLRYCDKRSLPDITDPKKLLEAAGNGSRLLLILTSSEAQSGPARASHPVDSSPHTPATRTPGGPTPHHRGLRAAVGATSGRAVRPIRWAGTSRSANRLTSYASARSCLTRNWPPKQADLLGRGQRDRGHAGWSAGAGKAYLELTGYARR
jgi:hypothetical protein